MIGKLARLGAMGWLATKAYQKYAETAAKPGPATLAKHTEVVGSDGGHVGTVDGVAIKLTRTDPTAGGQHHLIPWEQAGEVRNGKLFLKVTASEALGQQKTVVG